MMEMVVTTGAIKRAMLQSNRHHKKQDTQLFTGRMPSCHPTNSIRSLKENPQYCLITKSLYVDSVHLCFDFQTAQGVTLTNDVI